MMNRKVLDSVSTVQQQLKHQCVINTTLIINPKQHHTRHYEENYANNKQANKQKNNRTDIQTDSHLIYLDLSEK